jgi:hypothetical protein
MGVAELRDAYWAAWNYHRFDTNNPAKGVLSIGGKPFESANPEHLAAVEGMVKAQINQTRRHEAARLRSNWGLRRDEGTDLFESLFQINPSVSYGPWNGSAGLKPGERLLAERDLN